MSSNKDLNIFHNIARVKNNSDIFISQTLGPRHFKRELIARVDAHDQITLNATQLNSTYLNLIEFNSTQLNSTQLNLPQLNAFERNLT